MRFFSIRSCRAFFLAAAGCGGDGVSTPSDTTTEDTGGSDLTDTTPTDTTPPDTTPDTPPDTPPDTTPDTTPDVTPDSTTGGVVGDPCYSSSDCSDVPGAGRLCLNVVGGALSFPGGYCSAVCTSAADCGPGSDCVDLYGIDRLYGLQGETRGAVLVGYVINDNFLRGIARNTELDVTIVRRRAVMASTFNQGFLRLSTVPMSYVEYQRLVQSPDHVGQLRFGDDLYFAEAQPLSRMEAGMEGSLLLTYPQTVLDQIHGELSVRFVGIFLAAFLVILAVGGRLSHRLLAPLKRVIERPFSPARRTAVSRPRRSSRPISFSPRRSVYRGASLPVRSCGIRLSMPKPMASSSLSPAFTLRTSCRSMTTS